MRTCSAVYFVLYINMNCAMLYSSHMTLVQRQPFFSPRDQALPFLPSHGPAIHRVGNFESRPASLTTPSPLAGTMAGLHLDHGCVHSSLQMSFAVLISGRANIPT